MISIFMCVLLILQSVTRDGWNVCDQPGEGRRLLRLSAVLQGHGDRTVRHTDAAPHFTGTKPVMSRSISLSVVLFFRMKGEENTVMRDYVLPDFSAIKKGFCKVRLISRNILIFLKYFIRITFFTWFINFF